MTPEELADLLHRLGLELDARQKETRQRSLSFQDALFDRFERAQRLGFGEGSSIYNSTQVLGDVAVGRNVFVGAFGILDGQYAKITIGDYVSISAGVHIYSHDTMLWSLSGGQAEKRVGPVAIGERCYIGSQAIVACGVTVGPCSVIASNSFVNDAVPARTVVGGAPARPIGRVEGEGAGIRVIFDR
jgi:acetyltransferase-like isoleucine patch superfamily enzyme